VEALEIFRYPSALFLLVVPAALLGWTWRRSGRAIVLPFDHAEPSSGAGPRFFLRLAESLPALVLAAVVTILAGPQKWDAPRSKRVLTNIEFCVDVSGSMGARFGDGTRYDGAMEAINQFIDVREGDAYGLTFFGNSVLHWCPLTTDVSAFRCAPPFMRPGNLPSWFGGTEIGRALLACRKVLLEREEGDRMIVLVSDGQSADLWGGRDEEIARDLRRDGIAVYTVHVADGQIPEEVVRIAVGTGGEAFKSEDPEGLKRVFERIDHMKRARVEKTRAEAADQFVPFCVAGLLLLGLSLLAHFGLRHTPW